jgi:hypothetical protein
MRRIKGGNPENMNKYKKTSDWSCFENTLKRDLLRVFFIAYRIYLFSVAMSELQAACPKITAARF